MSNNNKVYSYQSLDGEDFYWGQTDKDVEQREKDGYGHNPELEKRLKQPHLTVVHHDGLSDGEADFYERDGIARTNTMIYEGGFNKQTGGKRGFSTVRWDSTPVVAIDPKTHTVKGWWPSETLAGRATGTPRSNIHRTVKLRTRTANGLYWKSANQDWYETAVDPAELFPENCEEQ